MQTSDIIQSGHLTRVGKKLLSNHSTHSLAARVIGSPSSKMDSRQRLVFLVLVGLFGHAASTGALKQSRLEADMIVDLPQALVHFETIIFCAIFMLKYFFLTYPKSTKEHAF